MNILIDKNCSENELFELLKASLEKDYHRVGIEDIADDVIPAKGSPLFSEQTKADWDIIISSLDKEDNSLLQKYKNIPAVGLVTELDESKIYPWYDNLHAIYTNSLYKIQYYQLLGYPVECLHMVNCIKENRSIINEINRSAGYKVLYCPPVLSCSHIYNLSLIKIFNKLSKFSFHILAKEIWHGIYKYINNNIQVIDKSQVTENMFQPYDLIIASGSIARNALMNGKLVLVVGERGFGGIVCRENYVEMNNRNFSGRMGGKYLEPVPEQLISEEIIYAINERRKILEELQELLLGQQLNKDVDDFNNNIRQIHTIHQSFKEPEKYLQMCPTISANISLKVSGTSNKGQIIREPTGKIVGSVDEEYSALLNKFNGKITIKEILASENMLDPYNIEIIGASMKALWEKGIIKV